jgi:hypothetical protein
MSPTQALPSFSLALHPDHYKTVLPNISYPSRPSTHIPWSGSSAPLLFSKTTPPETTVASPTAQVPTPNIRFNTGSVPGTFYGVGMLIWHNLSKIIRKINQKLFGV